ncbi:D-glycero-D-manno-heptose 1,7-bisphosphate phosphatase [Novosphingobium sp. SG751A]|nr:D-glycero-D-manno-heptose 1,7-bisphosphate phosphatase [Novosphingobium sp. SG751A]
MHPDEWLHVNHVPHAGQPALFLDRDGTLIENVPYLADPEQIRIIEGTEEALRQFRLAGFAIIIVTNQSGIARGLCTPEQYRGVENRLQQLLGTSAADLVYASPYHPQATGPFGIPHSSRKPEPGMFLDARHRFAVDLARSVMVGDSLSDMRAAAAAGIGRLVHVGTGHGMTERAAVCAFASDNALAIELMPTLAQIQPMVKTDPC